MGCMPDYDEEELKEINKKPLKQRRKFALLEGKGLGKKLFEKAKEQKEIFGK